MRAPWREGGKLCRDKARNKKQRGALLEVRATRRTKKKRTTVEGGG